MKRISFLVLFFYCCSFVNPPQSRAVAPLAVLAPALVGATVMAIAGTQIALNSDPSVPSWSNDGYALTRSMWAYNKVLQGGAQVLLGKGINGVLDLEQAYRKGLLQGKQKLNDVINQMFPPGTPYPDTSQYARPDDIFPDGVLDSSCQSYINQGKTLKPTRAVYTQSNASSNAADAGFTVQCGPTFIAYYHSFDVRWKRTVLEGYWYSEPATWPTEDGPPPLLAPAQVPELANRINNAMAADPDVSDELDDVIKANPGVVVPSESVSLPEPANDISDYPPAQPVTNADVNQWAQGQSAAAQQDYIDSLQNLVDANPTNAELAAHLAEAQAEQAQQQADDVADTYNPISANPFEEAYNPGSFDIPARFTSFLSNVKSTGLFSFSSSFFNSLPGGGSPIYTVEAGTYGTHTIDLSETMSTGLTVLKTVLLLLFGFLSIRVVILKR